jgi:hypothetical protein
LDLCLLRFLFNLLIRFFFHCTSRQDNPQHKRSYILHMANSIYSEAMPSAKTEAELADADHYLKRNSDAPQSRDQTICPAAETRPNPSFQHYYATACIQRKQASKIAQPAVQPDPSVRVFHQSHKPQAYSTRSVHRGTHLGAHGCSCC